MIYLNKDLTHVRRIIGTFLSEEFATHGRIVVAN